MGFYDAVFDKGWYRDNLFLEKCFIHNQSPPEYWGRKITSHGLREIWYFICDLLPAVGEQNSNLLPNFTQPMGSNISGPSTWCPLNYSLRKATNKLIFKNKPFFGIFTENHSSNLAAWRVKKPAYFWICTIFILSFKLKASNKDGIKAANSLKFKCQQEIM